MNSERISIYYDLIKLGIGPQELKLLPRVTKFSRLSDTCLILETSRGKFALWLVSREENQLLVQLELLHLLKEKKITGFLYPILLKHNCFYGVLDDGRLFYITNWPELQPISLKNEICIRSLLQLVIDFRKATSRSDILDRVIPNMRRWDKPLNDKYRDMIGSFKSFAMLAKYRLNPTKFDRMYIDYAEELVNQAELALNMTKNSDYLKMVESIETFQPIINDFSRSNLRVDQNDQVFCMSLKEIVLDLPLVDLASLIVKTGRANRWSREWHDRIINIYHASFSLTDSDLKLISAYLAFPWEMYRLAARYYHNRVNWPVSIFVEKMERIIRGEEARKKLVGGLTK